MTARGSGLADRTDWRPGGRLLSVAGQDAWTGTGDNWLGVTAPIWWSQADAVTNPAWLAPAGLEVAGLRSVPEETAATRCCGHRPASPAHHGQVPSAAVSRSAASAS